MGRAQAEIEITASSSRLAAGLATARAKFSEFSGAVARGIGNAFRKINAKLEPGDTAKRAMGNFGGDLMSRGASAVVDAAQSVREFNRDLTRVRITAGQSSEWQNNLRRSMIQTSIATGVSTNELAKAASVYFDLTSDADGMSKSLDSFGQVALASGANMEDIVRAAAAMHDSMGIGADEYVSTFSGLIEQGKAGKVSLKDMGKEFPSLLAMFSKFGSGRQGVMEMGAAFQVGAKAFGSASQAATGLEAMMGMLQGRQKQLKGAGVDVFKVNKDGSVVLRNLSEIVEDIRNKKIDPRKWGKIFGENKEGRNFLEMLLKYPKLYDDIVAAGGNAGAVQADAMAMATSDAGRLDLAINRLKESIAAAFTPERITGFVNAVEGLVDKLEPAAELIGKIGGVLGGLVGVGKKVRGALGGNGGRPFTDVMMDEGIVGMAGQKDWRTGKPLVSDMEVAGARSRLADDEARKAAQGSILGAEKDERTTPESIRRAVLAANSGREWGKGKIGEQIAGEQYLRAAGVGPEDRAKIEQQILAELPKAIRDGFSMLLPSIAKPPEVKIGDNTVAAANAQATAPRRGAR